MSLLKNNQSYINQIITMYLPIIPFYFSSRLRLGRASLGKSTGRFAPLGLMPRRSREDLFRCARPKGALPLWTPHTRRREARVLGQAVASLPSSPTPEPEAGVTAQASRGFRGISSTASRPPVFHDPLTPAPFRKWRGGQGSRSDREAA